LVYKGQYNYTFLYIKKSFPRAVNWGIRLTDHVAPCSCRRLLETAPARLLPALEARPRGRCCNGRGGRSVAAGLAGEEDPVPDPPTGDLYRSRNKSKCGVIRCVSNRDDITRFPRRTREGWRQSEE